MINKRDGSDGLLKAGLSLYTPRRSGWAKVWRKGEGGNTLGEGGGWSFARTEEGKC